MTPELYSHIPTDKIILSEYCFFKAKEQNKKLTLQYKKKKKKNDSPQPHRIQLVSMCL